MNTIESDFLKTVNKHIKVIGDVIIVNQVSLAKELAGKVERFETWRKQNIKCTKTSSYWLQTKCFKTFDDLYNFWLKEIDTKK
jgi:hypothetical protein